MRDYRYIICVVLDYKLGHLLVWNGNFIIIHPHTLPERFDKIFWVAGHIFWVGENLENANYSNLN